MENNVSTVLQIPIKNTPDNFTSGKISQCFVAWTNITSDKWVLDIVRNGYQIEFETEPPERLIKSQIVFNKHESDIISHEVDKLLQKQVIRQISEWEVKFVSSIFIRPKRDGSHRMILNLRELNQYVHTRHFKMETLKTALSLVNQDCFFASIDLKDAYYSIPVHRESQGWLVFSWMNFYYAFTALPNGLATAPRIYTKMVKPVFSSLRKIGCSNVSYIDDSLLKSNDREDCEENVSETVNLVDSLGFTVHPDKSVLIPTQEIIFVGFLINSVTMTVRLTPEKANDIVKECLHLLKQNTVLIRDVAKIIGKFVASEPGVQYAPLYYKTLEIEKDEALKISRGNFDVYMSLSEEAVSCLYWWINNIERAYRPIVLSKPDIIIESDSSLIGYGAINKTSHTTFSGLWSKSDSELHINFLEMKAAFLSLQYFCSGLSDKHVRLYLDNTVAIKYLDKMGGRKVTLNNLTKEIWEWCKDRNIWISVFHIPGSRNCVADALSRKNNEDMEWMLCSKVFQRIQFYLGDCEIDLFASKSNFRLPQYVSYRPDHKAFAVNAFSLSWTNLNAYLFPPFSLIGMVLQKIQQDKATVTLVAPIFHTQPWFPTLLTMICQQPYLLPKPELCLTLPYKKTLHPLKKMRLGIFKVSGVLSLIKEYQGKLQTSSCLHGENQPKNSIGRMLESGCHFVSKGKLISLIPV